MKRFRKFLLWFLALPLLLLLVVVGLLFIPAVQTFLVKRVLASKPEIRAQVDEVAVGMGGAHFRGLRYEQPGILVSAPSFEADLPLMDLAGQKIDLTRLVAHDVVIEIDPVASAAHAAANPPAPAATPAPSTPFAGLLKTLALPASLRAGGVDLAGTIRVAGATPVNAAFTLKGGGLAPGAEGAFTLTLTASASQGKVISELLLRPTLGTDGQLSALSAVLDATAESAALAAPAKLRTELSITRAGEGETYQLRVASANSVAPLVELSSSWAPGTSVQPGRWKLALTDADLAPFVLGRALPSFSLKGDGEVTATAADRFRLGGQIKLAANSLERVAGAPALGPVNADLRFGVEMSEGQPRVEALSLTVSSAAPVLSVEVRQPFSYDSATRKLVPSRPGAELCDVVLLGLPVAWIKPYLPAGLGLDGPLTGAWAVRAEDDGFAATASAPLLLGAVRMDGPAGPQWVFDAIRVEGSHASFGPAGLVAGIERVRAQRNGADVLSLAVGIAQKPSAALTAKGDLRASLTALTAQPALAGASRLSGGTATLSFDTTVGESLKAKVLLGLTGLRAGSAGELPEVTLSADVTRDAAGSLAIKLPVTVRNAAASRSSDLELTASLTPNDGQTRIAAKLASQSLHVPDLQIFAALAPATPPPAAAAPNSTPVATPAPVAATPAAGPLWAGYSGELELALARVVYAPGLIVTNIEGKVALTPDTLSLQGLKAALGTGRINLGGALNFVRPAGTYGLQAEAAASEIAVGPLLRALSPTQSVPLEGVFSLDAKLTGQGSDPAAAAKTAAGDVMLTGKNGIIRALNFETNRYAKAGSAIAGLAGLAGALSGNSELAQRGAQLTALNSVARQLGQLPFDDIVLSAKRGASGELEISDLSLRAPQLTLSGSGAIGALAGRGLVDQPLILSMKLGSRGDMAAALNTLGLLAKPAADTPADAFIPLMEPLVFDGSLRQVGTKQATRLLARALSL
jgi:hypothetical protein